MIGKLFGAAVGAKAASSVSGGLGGTGGAFVLNFLNAPRLMAGQFAFAHEVIAGS